MEVENKMEDMLSFIEKYPEMVIDARDATQKADLPNYKPGKDYNKILVCGMGGSAIGGELLNNLLRDLRGTTPGKLPIYHIEVSRRYKIPSNIDDKTLVFCVSYSGNTEETLSQFVELKKMGAKTIAITSDGKLGEWCENLGVPLIKIPRGFRPRAAMPYLFVPLVEYVAGKTLEKDINESIDVLRGLANDEKERESIRKIAGMMKGHWIVVYGPAEFEAVAYRAKTQINENSKLPASWGVFPELCHNEIVGYEDNDLNNDAYVLILRDAKAEENEAMSVRIEATKDIIESKVKGIAELRSVGESKLARMLSLLFYLDMLSYFLATEDRKSPEKNDNIDRLKAVLREKVNMQERLEKELI
jgi:glucose/mannose-6-phosphate isomerase